MTRLLVSCDGCRRDEDGYYRITGCIDDVLNYSGHRFGTAEVESALVAPDAMAEAAVVGYPHPINGQGIYAYVIVSSDCNGGGGSDLQGTLKEQVRHVRRDPHCAGPAQDPQRQDNAPHPARSPPGEYEGLGDVTTLAEPEVGEADPAARGAGGHAWVRREVGITYF